MKFHLRSALDIGLPSRTEIFGRFFSKLHSLQSVTTGFVRIFEKANISQMFLAVTSFFHKSSWPQWLLPRRRKRLFVRILLPDFSNVSLMRVLDFRRTFIGKLGRNFSNITLVRVLTERYFHLQIFGKILSYARHGLGTC